MNRCCALRVECAYRTVSEPAVLVIAGGIPIKLLYTRKGVVGKKQASQEGRTNSLPPGKQKVEDAGPRHSYLA